jgi:hypothetical protein
VALVDDASVLPMGSVSVSISTTVWQGTDLREIFWPVADVAVGVLPHLQIAASVPRVMDNTDAGGSASGVGTMFMSGKIGVMNTTGVDGSGVKLAIAPAVEVLGPNAAASLGPGESRTRWGLPFSAEVDRGRTRTFGSAGYFSGGVWFAGGGIAGQALSRLGVSVSFSHAWTTNADPALVRQRTEWAAGAAILATTHISFFGALSRTIATADENGAGTTVSAGISLSASRAAN